MELYLETLPEPVIGRLFQSPASCLALLRLLPPLAKTIVLRLLFNPSPVPTESLDLLVKPRHRRIQLEALQKLRNLKIVKERFTTSTLEINHTFQKSLQTALTSGPANESFLEAGQPLQVDVLRNYQREKWESMLHFMVSSAGDALSDPQVPSISTSSNRRNQGIGGTFLNLLMKSGLLSRGRRITSQGFQFLLQDQQTQVWSLLLHYLSNAAELGMDPTDILNFIFKLGTLELGKGHAINQLSPQYRKVLEELAELGIVYVNNGIFYAAIELTAQNEMDKHANIVNVGTDQGQLVGDPNESKKNGGISTSLNDEDGFIIIETNYRLYAYTDSPLQISILNLFCSLKSRFANLVIGRLTRNSSRRAMANGITADQIVQYLQANQKGGGALPPTIIDQIRLWQLELDRFKQAPGFLFKDFASVKQYAAVAQYAEDMGALLWKNDRTRIFFVDERSVKDVSEFVSRASV